MTGRGRTFWDSLGNAKTVRVIFLLMIVYFLVIGGLVLGYANVQNCLSDYSDESAKISKLRAQLAADDRRLSQRIEEVSARDRSAIIADQKGLQNLIQALIRQEDSAPALLVYQKINADSVRTFQANEQERARIALDRERIENARAQANPPDAPSERC